MKVGKYPGLIAATPNKVPLAINAIVAAYEEIRSEFLATPPVYESDIDINNNPSIQPSSVREPNWYRLFIDSQRKSKSESENDSKPQHNNKERLLIGFRIKYISAMAKITMSPTGYRIERKTENGEPVKVNMAGLRKNAVKTLVKPIAIMTVSSISRAPVLILSVKALTTPKKISG